MPKPRTPIPQQHVIGVIATTCGPVAILHYGSDAEAGSLILADASGARGVPIGTFACTGRHRVSIRLTSRWPGHSTASALRWRHDILRAVRLFRQREQKARYALTAKTAKPRLRAG